MEDKLFTAWQRSQDCGPICTIAEAPPTQVELRLNKPTDPARLQLQQLKSGLNKEPAMADVQKKLQTLTDEFQKLQTGMSAVHPQLVVP